MNRFLTEDTKAIIMLCGSFDRDPQVKPLGLREYTALVHWLIKAELRPSALMKSDCVKEAALGTAIDHERLQKLMGRGAQLGFAVDKWHQSGIWVISRSDQEYPARYKSHLKEQAPPLLFGAGDRSLLCGGGLAIVGSRAVDKAGEKFAREIAELCAVNLMPVVSGGARGVDQASMSAALEAGGVAIGVLAENLLRKSLERDARHALANGHLLLISPYHPEARFTVGSAMGRNKLIYAMADYGMVVSSDYNKGGTWAGATEELRRHKARPVFVRIDKETPAGNSKLLELGAVAWFRPDAGLSLQTQLSKAVAISGRNTVADRQGIFDFVMSRADTPSYRKIEPVSESLTMVKEATPEVSPKTLYEVALPVIMSRLSAPVTLEDLAANLEVTKSQLNLWLKRAVSEGKVERLTGPVRYRNV